MRPIPAGSVPGSAVRACPDASDADESPSAAWIKLAVLSDGLSVEPSFVSWFADQRGFAQRRNVYNTPVWGHEGALPQEIRLGGVVIAVNAYGASPWTLTWAGHDTGPRLRHRASGGEWSVEMVADLESLRTDTELASLANLYGGSALSFFTPRACYFFADSTQCRFCSLAGTAREQDSFANRLTPDQIRYAVDAVLAREPGRINQVMIVGGNERNLDRGFANHVALVQAAADAIAAHGLGERISVHLATMPPHDLDRIDALGAVRGVHVMFNLEVWDEDAFERIAPGKHRDYGRTRMMQALARLREAIGPYQAHSILIAGLEPAKSTVEGARALADMGISPIVNAYHSDRHSELGLTIRPSYRHLAAVAAGLQRVHEDYPVCPYWRGCGRNALDYEAAHGLFRGPVPRLD